MPSREGDNRWHPKDEPRHLQWNRLIWQQQFIWREKRDHNKSSSFYGKSSAAAGTRCFVDGTQWPTRRKAASAIHQSVVRFSASRRRWALRWTMFKRWSLPSLAFQIRSDPQLSCQPLAHIWYFHSLASYSRLKLHPTCVCKELTQVRILRRCSSVPVSLNSKYLNFPQMTWLTSPNSRQQMILLH